MALSDAVAACGDGSVYPALDAPATAERVLMAVQSGSAAMFDLDALRAAVAAHGRVARVVIAAVEGSAPREVGAAMLVWADGQSGTIGGGALEWEAAARARGHAGERARRRGSTGCRSARRSASAAAGR